MLGHGVGVCVSGNLSAYVGMRYPMISLHVFYMYFIMHSFYMQCTGMVSNFHVITGTGCFDCTTAVLR